MNTVTRFNDRLELERRCFSHYSGKTLACVLMTIHNIYGFQWVRKNDFDVNQNDSQISKRVHLIYDWCRVNTFSQTHTHYIYNNILYIYVCAIQACESYAAIRLDGLTAGHCYLLRIREEHHHFHPTTFKRSGYNILRLWSPTRLMSRTGYFFSVKKPNCVSRMYCI